LSTLGYTQNKLITWKS